MKTDYVSPEFDFMSFKFSDIISTSGEESGTGIVGSDNPGGANDNLG